MVDLPPPLPQNKNTADIQDSSLLEREHNMMMVRMAVEGERLRLLSWGYYLQGSINALIVSFLLIHFALFAAIGLAPASSWTKSLTLLPSAALITQAHSSMAGVKSPKSTFTAQVTPRRQPSLGNEEKGSRLELEKFRELQAVMRIVAAVIGIVILTGWLLSGLTIYAGRCVAQTKAILFVRFMAGLNCLFIPYGTILGVCTFVILSKPEVKRMFDQCKS
jgi:hypothetical protein